MIEYLTFGTTILIALSTGWIALRANRISAHRIGLESDKLLLDWAKRCVIQISRTISLRLLDPEEITEPRFTARRRELRAEIYACIGEGRLLLSYEGGVHEEINALGEIAARMSAARFSPPLEGDYESFRRPAAEDLMRLQAEFIQAMQKRMADQWVH